MTLAVRSLSGLPRKQQRRLQGGDSAVVAEELVAEELGANAKHRPDRAEWYDVVLETTGAKTEVKSCWRRVGDAHPADGRFRLRRDQLRSLLSSNASGTAWVAFVLFDENTGEARVRRVTPSTAWGWVNERGGWNEAGHDEFDYQHKLPWDEVFSR